MKGFSFRELLKDNEIIKIFKENFKLFFVGMFIMLFIGLFYLGSIPVYFGVNNEFVNPSNDSLGLNKSVQRVAEVGINVITDLMEDGAKHPVFWFWFFWVVVFYFMIYPILKTIWQIIKLIMKRMKGGKN